MYLLSCCTKGRGEKGLGERGGNHLPSPISNRKKKRKKKKKKKDQSWSPAVSREGKEREKEEDRRRGGGKLTHFFWLE